MTLRALSLVRRSLAAAAWMTFAVAVCLSAASGQDKPLKLDFNLFGGKADGGGNHLQLSGSFQVEKETRRGTLTLSADIDAGWHVYSLTQVPGGPQKSQIKVAESPSYKQLGPFQPDRAPDVKPPAVFPVPAEEHEGMVNWTAPIELAEGVDPEKLTIELKYSGQVCDQPPPLGNGVCIPISEQLVPKFAGYLAKAENPGEFRPDENQGQVVFKGHVEPAGVKPGGKVKLLITAEPNPGWHIYAYATKDSDKVGANKPTLIYLPPLVGWTRSGVKASTAPKEKPALLKGLPNERSHDGPVTWTIELTAPANAAAGEALLTGFLGYQTCDDKSCLPPQALQFRASVPVTEQPAAGNIPLEFSPLERSPGDGKLSGYKYVASLAQSAPAAVGKVDLKSLAPMVAFGLVGGLILNLMPCVLPVIGLKLLSLVQHAGHSRAKIFALNLWFSIGLLTVFFVLATLAAFANLGWGEQFTYTWFKVAMVVIVFAFALSFLGVWEIPMPGMAQSETSSKLQHQEGASGAYFKGVFTTLLATPCSGPLLGSVFAFTLDKPPLVTYVLFGSVGLGMALPYLLVGAFPGLVRSLPKPGAWMDIVKHLMGFVLLGTVVYLFSTINRDYFIPTLALMMGTWLACWIIGRVPGYEDAGKQVRQWALGVASAVLIGWLSFEFLGPVRHLYEWKPFSPQTVAALQAEGKTVMVDFTADWCLTCQYNFKYAINTRRVKELVERNGVVPLLADWTDYDEMIKRQLAELNSNSIPLMAIYPAKQPGEPIILRDALLERHVLEALEEAGPSSPADAGKAQVASAKGGE